MECTNCGSPSARLYSVVADGAKIEVRLCDECYQKLYPQKDEGDIFAHLFGNSGVKTKKSIVCPSCGMPLEAFRKSGLLGCSGCYTAFRSEIYNSVRYCQWDSMHRGKEPCDASEEKYDLVREQEYIRSQIDAAFAEGKYSLAEQLNRRLQAIHAKLARLGEA